MNAVKGCICTVVDNSMPSAVLSFSYSAYLEPPIDLNLKSPID